MQQNEHNGIMSLIDQLNLVEGELSSITSSGADCDAKDKMDMIKEKLVSLLSEAITNFDVETRRGAAYGLSKIQDRSALPILYRALNDPDDVVRSWACEGLGHLREQENISHLINALFDRCVYVHYSASTALKRYDVNDIWPEIENKMASVVNNSDLKRVVKFSGEIRERLAIPYIRELISTEDDELRYECVEALRKIADISASDVLIECLNDTSRDVVACAIQAIKILKDYKALKPLIQIALENIEHRPLAMQAIEEIAGEVALVQVFDAIERLEGLVCDTYNAISLGNIEQFKAI